MDKWNPGTLYLKTVFENGSISVSAHECWNVDRFIENMVSEGAKHNFSVTVLTPSRYRAMKWPARNNPPNPN